MIDRGEGALRIEDLQPEIAQHAECLWAGDFVNKVGADEQLRGSVWQFAHRVRLPYLIQQCLAHTFGSRSCGEARGSLLQPLPRASSLSIFAAIDQGDRA